MHNYKETTIIHNYASSYYNGPALHVQTGAEGAAAGSYASAHGYTVVAGSCPTVKMVGHSCSYSHALGGSFVTLTTRLDRPAGILEVVGIVIYLECTASLPITYWNGRF